MTSQKTHALLPDSLKHQLRDFQLRLWTIKAIEAIAAAIFAVAMAYLALFAIDRLIDPPGALRVVLFLTALAGCAAIPFFLVRWVWRRRRLDQLARLLSRRHPSVGDQILGVIELVESQSEQARSKTLCEAAIRQVAEDAKTRDFKDAVPNPRHKLWAPLAAVPVLFAAFLLYQYPAAASNAWARLLNPFTPVPRYTFAKVESLPQRLVVPHGEPSTFQVKLANDSRWIPTQATAKLQSQPDLTAELKDGGYTFSLPSQIQPVTMKLEVGDVQETLTVEPMLRPELVSAFAQIQLPEYLERSEPLQKDVRSGSLTLVDGSSVHFTLTANRDLESALCNGNPIQVTGSTWASTPLAIDKNQDVTFEWKDRFGLTGLEPFHLAVHVSQDQPPTIACEDLPRQKVLLDTETIQFRVHARDDFGVKLVGIEWKGVDNAVVSTSAQGERILSAGHSEAEVLEVAGTFCPRDLGIEPQPVTARLFAEDYLPGRERVYSPNYVFYILSPEQHAIWVADQLSKWHRQSLEVRDREMQLHHANQQLRKLSAEELDLPETRRKIEAQSAAERANARRLDGLVDSGKELVRQAMRNPEIGVGHLEKWAEMLKILDDISQNRMPNVADLLKQSAQAPGQIARNDSKPAPQAGKPQDTPASSNSDPKEDSPKPSVPNVVDAESTQQPQKPSDDEDDPNDPSKNSSPPRMTLPVTIVPGDPGKSPPPPPAEEKLDEAVKAQQDLLAEFEKVADELNKVLANLEGSTLVKRLKAASRKQYLIAGKIGEQIPGSFGRPKTSATPDAAKTLRELAASQTDTSQEISNIMDDLQAYFERRNFQRFKSVLDEMRQQDAVGSIRQLGDDIPVESGMSLAQCEYWSDTFDRWADNLVDPASSGQCPGGKSKSSLPPSIVLEAMQILEAEVNLREETRVAQQARKALTDDEYAKRAATLESTQTELADRTARLADRVRALPAGESEFANEIKLLQVVDMVMNEAAEILATPETGSPAIAAETEAIELLLQSRKINPNGGGGGGSNPGGGGGGTTVDSALALLGAGINDKEVLEERPVEQVTGKTGDKLPEEFRAGLDQYFNRLEQDRQGQ